MSDLKGVVFRRLICLGAIASLTAEIRSQETPAKQETQAKEGKESEGSPPNDELAKQRQEVMLNFREPNSEPKPHVLRMMSRPTYRYGKPDGEIIDGALFTYVVATDPEACLLIEIHRKDDVISWEYMVLPMTIYSLEAKLDDKSVWVEPETMVFGNSTAPHFISPFRRDRGEPALKTLFPAK